MLRLPNNLYALVFFTACFAPIYSQGSLKPFEEFSFSQASGGQTDALLVIQDGKILLEKYANGYTAEKKHLTWSISKSIASAVIGIAEQKKILSRGDLVSKYIPEIKNPELKIEHLLHMSSGIDWNEGYENNPFVSDVVSMLYNKGVASVARYVLSRPFRSRPSEQFYYSSGDTNLLMYILKKSMNQEQYDAFAWKELFEPLGMKSATWEQDPEGTFVGSSYFYSTARDLAKFGQLFLDEGKVNGKTVLTKEWVQFCKTPGKVFQSAEGKFFPSKPYGAHWWLNAKTPSGVSSPFSRLPEDALFAIGHEGQVLAVIPSKKMIVVRFAYDSKKGNFDREKWLNTLMDSLGEQK